MNDDPAKTAEAMTAASVRSMVVPWVYRAFLRRRPGRGGFIGRADGGARRGKEVLLEKDPDSPRRLSGA